ncbi:MAG: hypothetical protein EZS28_020526, partial [Streblomastix strix]
MNSEGSSYSYFHSLFTFLQYSYLLIIFTAAQEEDIETCPIGQKTFAYDDGEIICIPDTFCISPQVVVDLDNRQYGCVDKCDNDEYLDVSENHLTVYCVTPCPALKTQTTLPSGVMKCVDSCPYGQFRFRRRDGSYVCQTHCTGFEKALELDDGSIQCIVNNCQDPTPVLQLDQSSSSGYQCVAVEGCTLPQTSYTFDDITQVCVDPCPSDHYLIDIDQAQPMCYTNPVSPNPYCTSGRFININRNNQIECVESCTGYKIPRRFDNGTVICVNYCPMNQQQIALEDNTYICIDQCNIGEINKYDPETKTFSCILKDSCETSSSLFERFEMDSGDLICIKKCSDSLVHVDVGTDIPVCRAKCSGSQPYLNVDLIAKDSICVDTCPDGKIHADYGNSIIKCVERCPESKFMFRKDDSTARLFTSYPFGGENLFYIRLTNEGIFYVTKGWLATLNIDTLTVYPVNMTRDSLIYVDSTSGAVSINNSYFEEGAYHQFNLKGAFYRTSGSSYIGKGLFIETDNIADVIRRSELGTKFGVIESNPQINEIYMIGIQSSQKWLTIPLQYAVNNVTSGIYHINNPNTTSWKYEEGKGNDNDYCGWIRFPCATFGKAVIRSITQHPEINSEVKIGIVQGYILDTNTTSQIDAKGRKVSISNQLDYYDESTGTYQIKMYVKGNGQYSFSNGSFSVTNCSLIDQGYASTTKYIISMQQNSKSIEIKYCTFTTELSAQADSHGLIEIKGGSVNIEQLVVNNVRMSECNFIKLNYGAGQVNISSSTFTGISSIASNGGSVIFGQINGTSRIRLSNLTFTQCISLGTTGKTYGGAIQLYTSGVGIDINNVQFSNCSGLNGGGMFIRQESSSSVKFSNNSKFEHCTDNSQQGGGLHLNINDYSSCELDNVEFDTCKAQQFGGGLFGTISSGGTLTIMNTTTFTSCSCVGSGKYQEGGGININIKDGNSKFLINGLSSFTSCTSKDLGGAVNINGSLGAMINIKYAQFTNCSSEGGGGLNTRLQSSSILNITEAVNFTFCESTSQNGGGIRAILTEIASSLYVSGSSIFNQCTTSGQGGGIYINSYQSKITINTVLFENCEAIQGGGAIGTLLTDGGFLTVEGLTNFTSCKTTGDTEAIEDLGGGAIYANISHASSKFRIIGTVKFDQCESTIKGGAIYIKAQTSQLIEINKATFYGCICTKEGGGIYAYINNGGSFRLTNVSTFTQCKSISGSGGGLYAIVKTTTSQIQISQGVTFDGCESELQGGGIYISAEQSKINEINKMIVTGCQAKLEGSGLYIEIIQSAFLSISNGTSFSDCASSSITSSGGGIYAKVKDIDSRFVLSDQIKFENCNSSVSGGGISFLIQGRGSVELIGTLIQNCNSQKGAGICALIESGSQLTILNSNQFSNCMAAGNEGIGGGICADIGDSCKLRIYNGVIFDSCTSYGYGGGAYLIAKDRGIVDMNQVTFNQCNSTSGGAIFIDIQKSASLIITNSSLFKDCEASTGNGGGIYATIKDIGSKLIIQDQSIFDTCQSLSGFGGAAYIELQSNASVIINRAKFDNCSAFDGGAIQTSLLTGSTFTIANETLFNSCSSTGSTSGGGGINANIDSFSKFIISSNVQFDTCTCTYGKGGAGYFVVKDKGTVEVNQAIFTTCSSVNGGGLYVSLDNSSSLSITNSNQFSGCTTSSGSGGGLYAQVKDPDSKLLIEDNSYFFECISTNGQGGAGYIEGS